MMEGRLNLASAAQKNHSYIIIVKYIVFIYDSWRSSSLQSNLFIWTSIFKLEMPKCGEQSIGY